MQAITTIGLDIAKSVFQVHGVDAAGQVNSPSTEAPLCPGVLSETAVLVACITRRIDRLCTRFAAAKSRNR